MNNYDLPVAIIGGGPIGLSAAAHLKKSKQPFILFETGSQIGANISKWGHVRLFSPWEYNIDKAAENLLREAHLPIPNKADVPYGKEIIEDYLKPLANLPGIKEHIHLNSKVIAIGRSGLDKMKDVHYVADYTVEEGVLSCANKMGADLIIMPTHGRKGLAHFFEGSIGEDVANHATLPVMTFKI